MDLKTAKEKFSGIFIKDRGFSSSSETQFVFKSEVNKNSKLGYLINDSLYILPSIIKDSLKSYLQDNNTKLPSGVEYISEKFTVPFSYLQLFASDATPPSKPTEEIVSELKEVEETLNVGTYTSGSYTIPILNKVAETAAKYRIMDSVDFYTSAMMHKRDIEDQMKYLLDEFIVKGTDESFTNLVLAGILYQKAQ